jgi:hypothetical protein
MPPSFGTDLRPPQAGERPNGRRGQCRAAKPPEAAPAIEAKAMRVSGHGTWPPT